MQQAGTDMLHSASAALTSSPSSLRQFARFGFFFVGIVAGVSAVAGQVSKREAAFRAAIADRDVKIEELSVANAALKSPSDADKPSSGDPVQDWIDSLSSK